MRVQGPEYTFTISGGYCTLDKDTKSVTCVKPEVTLEKTAGTCTLKYTSPTTAFVSPPAYKHHCYSSDFDMNNDNASKVVLVSV